MTVHLVRPDASPDRLYPGAPYAYAATVGIGNGAGTAVFTAGACPVDVHGDVVAAGDVAAQMRHALANLETALAESGATLRDVVKTTVYVAGTDRADLLAAWAEVAAAFGDHPAPSTLLGVTVLGYPGQLVEIEAVAVAPTAAR
jgi:enamine deaminase RidA (YjgF/YER057c/UK114 family)